MRKFILIIGILLCSVVVFGQKENKQINAGNKAYQARNYKQATLNYRQALKINPQNQTAKFNLANALEKQKNTAEAEKLYQQLAKSGRKTIQSDAYYNKGVSQAQNKDLKNAISSFENSLRKNPNDQSARENLQKAINDLKKQQNQNKQNKNQQNKQNQQNQQPKESPKEKQNKQNMDNLLKQLNEQEKDLQKKLQQQQQQNQPRKQPEKDW